MAIAEGATVISTTRSQAKRKKLLAHGVSHVILDTANMKEEVFQLAPNGVDLVLELLGVSGLVQSIQCAHPFGLVCLTGILNDQFISINTSIKEDRTVPGYPHPMELIPPTVRLTVGGVNSTPRTPGMVQKWINSIEEGVYRMPIDSSFTFDEIDLAIQRWSNPDHLARLSLM